MTYNHSLQAPVYPFRTRIHKKHCPLSRDTKASLSNWKENEIAEDKEPAGTESGRVYRKGIRGLPSVSHGDCAESDERGKVNKTEHTHAAKTENQIRY